MAEIKVRAADSSLAMDEVQKRLGDDALIISTTKKDGQIEIIATDDALAVRKNEIEPLILGEAYKISDFDSILRQKVVGSSLEESKSLDFENAFDDRLNAIISDLSNLKSLLSAGIPGGNQELDVLTKLQMIGFRKKILDNVGIRDKELSPEAATKKIAKAFVSGKSPKFENSSLYLILGDPYVGKSTFAKKFYDLMKSSQTDRDFELVQDNKLRKMENLVRDLRKTIDSDGINKRALIVDFNSSKISLNDLFKMIDSQKEIIDVSVIRVIEVGRSYEFLMKVSKYQVLFQEYVAFSKLDVCDLSIPEISAMLETENQCMFLSGNDSSREGLFFAKVDQVASFLLNKFRDEHG